MMASVNNILIKDSFMYVVKSLFPNRGQLFLTKEKIENTCGITPGYYWTDDEIIKAWKEKQKISMFKQQEKQRWNRVMRIQVIQLFCKELSKIPEAQSDVIKSRNKTKPCYKFKPKSRFPKLKRRPKKPRGRKRMPEHSSDKDRGFSSEPHSRQAEQDNSGKEPEVEFVDELIDGCPSRQEKKEIANEAKPCDTLMPTPSDGPESRSSKPERRTQTPQGGKRRDKELSLEKENKSSLEAHNRQAEEDNSGKNSEQVEFVYKFIDECPSRQEEKERENEETSGDKSMPICKQSKTIGIKIPLSKLFGSEATSGKNDEIRLKKTLLDDDRYDQGHLAAAANHSWCQEAYNDTYHSSNWVPQIRGINRGMWSSLEKACRDKLKDSRIRNIHVYTGPIYLYEQRSNGSAKAVPDSLFKVIIEEHKDGTVSKPECYLIPNSLDTVKEYEKPVVKDTEVKDTVVKDTKDKDTEDPNDPKYTEPSKGLKYTNYNVNIEEIENKSNLKFISTDVQQYTEKIRSMTRRGEDRKGEIQHVTIEVSINIPETKHNNV
ncbi:uncharacterized protein isoform X1 [Danio rerio]|uniref:Uncharacterized protein isoform X1 n=2 Tax=Danio rerio TaxID=7955 RepID=A0AC58J0H1_DANRE